MVQNTNVFWDFAVQIQLKNTFLHNTPSHLTKEQVCHCIKASMNLKLTLHCCSWNWTWGSVQCSKRCSFCWTHLNICGFQKVHCSNIIFGHWTTQNRVFSMPLVGFKISSFRYPCDVQKIYSMTCLNYIIPTRALWMELGHNWNEWVQPCHLICW